MVPLEFLEFNSPVKYWDILIVFTANYKSFK
jgi:hypothetical protein